MNFRDIPLLRKRTPHQFYLLANVMNATGGLNKNKIYSSFYFCIGPRALIGGSVNQVIKTLWPNEYKVIFHCVVIYLDIKMYLASLKLCDKDQTGTCGTISMLYNFHIMYFNFVKSQTSEFLKSITLHIFTSYLLTSYKLKMVCHIMIYDMLPYFIVRLICDMIRNHTFTKLWAYFRNAKHGLYSVQRFLGYFLWVQLTADASFLLQNTNQSFSYG